MKRLYVGNLPYSTTEKEIRSLFSPYGKIRTVALVTDHQTGRAKGFCFIEFQNTADTEKALVLNKKDFGGRSLRVNIAKPKKTKTAANRMYQKN